MVDVLHRDGRLEVTRLVVGGGLDNNVYLARCLATGRSALVDAANDPDRLVGLCREQGVEVVLQTHGHHDHIQAVPAVRAAGFRVGVHAGDAPMLPGWDFEVADGDVVEVGDLRIEAIHTPGHTPGSVCYAVEGSPVLFSGDTLFPGGPGATRHAYSSFPQIIRSIDERLFRRFPPDTRVLPGHGRDTTIGAEAPHLQEWVDRGW